MAIEKYYSANEVMAMLKISPTTLYRLQVSGELTPAKVGNLRRFAESDILSYLEKKKHKGETR
ncbi:helix-turn-helix domain-containing protein [Emergencia sp. 1XD21-10]|uniref:helix-turn-helix domain-containing protein n=1 Tax=Emergencia sp. 1XD21-10 TaxID=2304569 RepID=UPI00137B5913|nr:helix-turn-helix domain-containing protein [Emergencia sp. 1XD21-10]